MKNTHSGPRNADELHVPERERSPETRRAPHQAIEVMHRRTSDDVRALLLKEQLPPAEVARRLHEQAEEIRLAMKTLKGRMTAQQWMSYFNQFVPGMGLIGSAAAHGYAKTLEQPEFHRLEILMRNFVTFASENGVPTDDLLPKAKIREPGASLLVSMFLPAARVFQRGGAIRDVKRVGSQVIDEVLTRVDRIASGSKGPQDALAA